MTDRGYATPLGGRHGPAHPGPVSVPRHRVAVRAAAFRKDGRQALCGRLFSRLEASRSHGDRGLYQLSSNNSIALKHGCLPPPPTPGGPPLRLGPAAPGLALRHLRCSGHASRVHPTTLLSVCHVSGHRPRCRGRPVTATATGWLWGPSRTTQRYSRSRPPSAARRS